MCVCKWFLISLYVLHGGVWDWGHRFSKPPLLLGRIILRELIWYLAPIGPIRVPLFCTIVAGLKLKPSSSSWLAGLITLIKHHFDRIISLFLHIHSPVCHVSLSWIPSSLTIFILSHLPLFSPRSFSTANTCQSRERNLMRVFMWWFLRRCFFQRQLHQTLDWDASRVLVLICETRARKIRVYNAFGRWQCRLQRGQLSITEYLDLLFL